MTQQTPTRPSAAYPPQRRAPQRRRRRRRHPYAHLVKPGLIALGVLLAVIFLIADFNSFDLDADIPKEIAAEYGGQFQVPGQAVLEGGLLFKTEKDAKITLKEPLDTQTLGDQEVTFRVRAESRWLLFFARSFETTVKRTVTVRDTTAPVITLVTPETPSTLPGGKYVEEGFTATDNMDGDVTAQVTSRQEGDQVIYTVTDSAGNTATVVRDIRYREGPAANGKVIYLTFDDGPGIYTEELLDILAKYNVKATFFVVNTDYTSIIGRIAREGHTVGVHSYSHRLKQIYQSEDAFFADMEQMQEVIIANGGRRTNILRFPGGSSNELSRYNPGIMTRLSKAVGQHGYYYFDWNVDSNDASTAKTAEQVFENVKAGVMSRENSVVLQHDIKEFSVDAVEMIIVWGLENGYTFMPLDPSAPGCHHKIFN